MVLSISPSSADDAAPLPGQAIGAIAKGASRMRGRERRREPATSSSRKSRAGSPRSESASGSRSSSAWAPPSTPLAHLERAPPRSDPRRVRHRNPERPVDLGAAWRADRSQPLLRALLRRLVDRRHPADRDHRRARRRIGQPVHAAPRPPLPVCRPVVSAPDDRGCWTCRPGGLRRRRVWGRGRASP